MNKKTMATLMALSMLAMAFAFVPSATAIPCQHDTNGDGKKDTGDKDDCDAHYSLAGPASLSVKPVLSVGVGFCHGIDPTLALACDNTGGLEGAGGGAHPTTADCATAVNCTYNIWVQQSSGTGNGGFGVSVCTDRDDSGVCTNVGSDFDDFGNDGYTGDVINGAPKEGNKEGYAYTRFCVQQDHDNTFDDFWFFIFAWVDESVVFGDNLGVGVSVGTFDVWVDHKYNDDPGCRGDISDPATEGAKA